MLLGEEKRNTLRVTQFDFILSLCLTSREGEKGKLVRFDKDSCRCGSVKNKRNAGMAICVQ